MFLLTLLNFTKQPHSLHKASFLRLIDFNDRPVLQIFPSGVNSRNLTLNDVYKRGGSAQKGQGTIESICVLVLLSGNIYLCPRGLKRLQMTRHKSGDPRQLYWNVNLSPLKQPRLIYKQARDLWGVLLLLSANCT